MAKVFNQKRNIQREPEHRINDRIKVTDIRLVGENLDELSELIGEKIETANIISTRRALQWAEKAELDLIEISPNANPPVCRIQDYGKFLYEKKKKEKEMKANSTKQVLKEIRFGPHTEEHDFKFKVKHGISFLEEGSKLKAYVQFRGRAIVFKQYGEDLLKRFMEELKDYGVADAPPKLEGKRMFLMMSPKKKK